MEFGRVDVDSSSGEELVHLHHPPQAEVNVNTKGCCFVCFKPIETLDEYLDTDLSGCPVDKLCRYLKLDVGTILRRLMMSSNEVAAVGQEGGGVLSEERLLKVALCDGCRGSTSKFSVLSKQLERIRTEMEDCLKVIQKCIAEADGSSQRVDNFYDLMSADEQSLARLEIVDELRSKIFLKGSAFTPTHDDNPVDKNEADDMDMEELLFESVSVFQGRRNGLPKPVNNNNVRAPPDPQINGNRRSSRPSKPTPSRIAYLYARNNKTIKTKTETNYETIPEPEEVVVQLNSSEEEDDDEDDIYGEDDLIDDDDNPNSNSCLDPLSFLEENNNLSASTSPESADLATDETMPESPPSSQHSTVESPAKVTLNGSHDKFKINGLKTASASPTTSSSAPPPPNQPFSKYKYVSGGKYACSKCFKQFNTREGFAKHYSSVHLKLRHKCDLCEKDFHSRASLTRHYKMAHLNVRFKCLQCNSIFTLKTNLRQHQRMTRCGKVGNRQVIDANNVVLTPEDSTFFN